MWWSGTANIQDTDYCLTMPQNGFGGGMMGACAKGQDEGNKFYQSWYVFRNQETDHYLQIAWDTDARKEDSRLLLGGFHNEFATAAQFLLHLVNSLMEVFSLLWLSWLWLLLLLLLL